MVLVGGLAATVGPSRLHEKGKEGGGVTTVTTIGDGPRLDAGPVFALAISGYGLGRSPFTAFHKPR